MVNIVLADLPSFEYHVYIEDQTQERIRVQSLSFPKKFKEYPQLVFNIQILSNP